MALPVCIVGQIPAAWLVSIHEPIIWRLSDMMERLKLRRTLSSVTSSSSSVAMDPRVHIRCAAGIPGASTSGALLVYQGSACPHHGTRTVHHHIVVVQYRSHIRIRRAAGVPGILFSHARCHPGALGKGQSECSGLGMHLLLSNGMVRLCGLFFLWGPDLPPT